MCVGSVSDRILIMVLGDHGMTPDGNHGGASDFETLSALFIYSSTPLAPISPRARRQMDGQADHLVQDDSEPTQQPTLTAADVPLVQQIDLVPTLALLLGVPIPYANLGQLLPDLFLPAGPDQDHRQHLVAALRQNAWQVHRYLEVTCACVQSGGDMNETAAVVCLAFFRTCCLVCC
jgi:phosphatidylinositol glycan class O